MKKTLYFLGFALLLASIFYAISARNKFDIFGTTFSVKKNYTFLQPKERAPASGKSLMQKSKDLYQESTAATKREIVTLLDTTENNIQSLWSEGKDIIKERLADTLGIASPRSINSSSSPVEQSSVYDISPPSTSPAIAPTPKIEICAKVKKEGGVGYMIENPFFPRSGFSFRISWGDNAVSNGEVKKNERGASASHVYASRSNYTNIFQIISSSGTIEIQRRVCVE